MLPASGLACIISLFIGWYIRGTDLLPVKDELFLTDIIMCLVALALSLTGLLIFVFFVSHFLVNAKKEELEKNNEQVANVLSAVQTLSENLHSAGLALSSVSENESSSAEELASTSQQLVSSSQILGSKTDESMTNLGELSEWEGVVADNVGKVEQISGDLLNKSAENEKLLGDLHTINAEVSESMKMTTEITQRLSNAVQEIDVTLNLINNISSSTNLLALNASIEAGRGFAVVATEVGNLASSTQESLQGVQTVIERVQQNVADITAQVNENAAKLVTQNEYFEKVFQCMRDMTGLLNSSVEAVNTMGEAHGKQAEVIKKTISINQDIAESIRNENEQFGSINTMAEGNAADITEVVNQTSKINDMVEQMTQLLSQDA